MVRSTDRPAMTIAVDLGRKATNKQTNQIFALDSAVVEVQEMFSSHGSLLTNAMYHHGETL